MLSTTEDQLRCMVRVMRELGVVSWDGITLGPEPMPRRAPPTDEQREAFRVAFEKYERAHAEWSERMTFAHVEDPGPEPEPPVMP